MGLFRHRFTILVLVLIPVLSSCVVIRTIEFFPTDEVPEMTILQGSTEEIEISGQVCLSSIDGGFPEIYNVPVRILWTGPAELIGAGEDFFIRVEDCSGSPLYPTKVT